MDVNIMALETIKRGACLKGMQQIENIKYVNF